MKKFMLFAIAMLISPICMAAPDTQSALKWEHDLHAVKSSAFDALILKDPIKRRNTMQTILKLRDRAEKLFGNYDDCTMVASGLVSVYQTEIELTMGGNHAYIEASGLASFAWESGQKQDICEAKIDALK